MTVPSPGESPNSIELPRPEYPRPTLVRPRWLNLNGRWNFALDPSDRGLAEAWQHRKSLPGDITVPFCFEAEAARAVTDETEPNDGEPPHILWYHRTFERPEGWANDRLLLHIGASDQWTTVFINGQQIGQNQGGYAPFAFDVAHAVRSGENHLSIRVEDSPSWSQPRGKQEGTTRWPIDYDPVTGIWQTVWLEPVPTTAITDVNSVFERSGLGLAGTDSATTDAGSTGVNFTTELTGLFSGALRITLAHAGKTLGEIETAIDRRSEVKTYLPLATEADDLPLWSPEQPNLCDVTVELLSPEGHCVDEVQSYLGLREISVVADQMYLNGEPLYLRGVLDQGYFPGGWYTATSDDDFRRDIELTKAMGFNCARKHQKAEDPRYLYWADRLGLLVWAEMPSGRIFSGDLVQRLTTEWLRLIRRDRAHPCIMAWVPFNESWGVWNQRNRPQQRALVDALVALTRALDTSRPVIGNDGWEYSSGDLWTLHLYEGDTRPLAERLANVLANPEALLQTDGRAGALPGASVEGLPVLLTECGGIGYEASAQSEKSQGGEDVFAYGELPTSPAELERRIRAIAQDINGASALRGFVWTQLTDVQQEMNGLLTFDRKPKLPLETLAEVFKGIGDA